MKAILDSDVVYEKLGSAYAIESIVNKANAANHYTGGYNITSTINSGQRCTVNVKIKHLPLENDSEGNMRIGEEKFDLIVGNRVCR